MFVHLHFPLQEQALGVAEWSVAILHRVSIAVMIMLLVMIVTCLVYGASLSFVCYKKVNCLLVSILYGKEQCTPLSILYMGGRIALMSYAILGHTPFPL